MFACVNSLSTYFTPLSILFIYRVVVNGMTNSKQFSVILIDFIVGYFNIILSASIIIHRYFSFCIIHCIYKNNFISVGHHYYGFTERQSGAHTEKLPHYVYVYECDLLQKQPRDDIVILPLERNQTEWHLLHSHQS